MFDIEDEITLEHGEQVIKGRFPGSSTSVPSTPKQSPISSHVQSDYRERIHANPQRQKGVAEAFSHGMSPLAQVYAPLQVEDDDRDENGVASQSATQTPAATSVNFGPAIRRRHHRRMSNDQTPLFSEERLGIRRSASRPGHVNERHSLEELTPKSVIEVESEEQLSGGINMELRLEGLEERQKRIEDMLIQLIERKRLD